MSNIRGIYAVHDKGHVVIMPDTGGPICVLSDTGAELLAQQLIQCVCEARGIDYNKTLEQAAKQRIELVSDEA